MVYVDGVRSGLPITWSFVRADGSVALKGAGYHDDPTAPGGAPVDPAPIEHYSMSGCFMEHYTVTLRATATGFQGDVMGTTSRVRFPHTYAARMGAGGVVEVLGSDGHVIATTGTPASLEGGFMDPFDAC